MTPRVALARVALSAAVGAEGVVAGNAGPGGQYVTGAGDETLRGVVVTAEPAGRYGVDLYLTAGLVPLHPLGEHVRELVEVAAAAADMGARLGGVTVTVLDVQPAGPAR